MTRLLIVESPNKTDKIQHYLGSGWVVAASYGHIRDLPPGEMGVAPPDYRPQYVTGERSGKTIAKLKALARDADEIWLATDPDREGEAIAWHLQQVIGHGKTCRRVTFNEITLSAVAQAIRQPRQVDTKLFAAQEARRVLDRLYGYKVSPLAGNKLGQRGISAGRVQSPALRLVVERKEAIRLQRRPGKKKGTFWWGCDRYPACTHSAPDVNLKPGMWGERPPAGSDGTKTKAASGRKKGSASGDKATPGKNSKALDKTYPCTACGKGWLPARSGSRGAFWGCSNYPNCTHSENDAHGVPQNHVKKTS